MRGHADTRFALRPTSDTGASSGPRTAGAVRDSASVQWRAAAVPAFPNRARPCSALGGTRGAERHPGVRLPVGPTAPTGRRTGYEAAPRQNPCTGRKVAAAVLAKRQPGLGVGPVVSRAIEAVPDLPRGGGGRRRLPFPSRARPCRSVGGPHPRSRLRPSVGLAAAREREPDTRMRQPLMARRVMERGRGSA